LACFAKLSSRGNLDRVKHALSSVLSPLQIMSWPSARRLTPLALSIIYDQVDIKLGYRAKWVNRSQYVIQKDLLEVCPPIYCVARLGFADLVDLLILYGADINSVIWLDKGSLVVPLYIETGKRGLLFEYLSLKSIYCS
jgi:hypothetical protein